MATLIYGMTRSYGCMLLNASHGLVSASRERDNQLSM